MSCSVIFVLKSHVLCFLNAWVLSKIYQHIHYGQTIYIVCYSVGSEWFRTQPQYCLVLVMHREGTQHQRWTSSEGPDWLLPASGRECLASDWLRGPWWWSVSSWDPLWGRSWTQLRPTETPGTHVPSLSPGGKDKGNWYSDMGETTEHYREELTRNTCSFIHPQKYNPG